MDGTRFDHLTRRFAQGSSRRRVVKALGGGIAGAFLGAVSRDSTEAANNTCAHFCNAIFPPGPARGKCKSDGAKHVPGNLCDACGSDPANFCDGICCTEGTSCCGGACCPDGACEDDVCCADGNICNGECCPDFAPLCCPDESGDNVCTVSEDGNCGACGVTCLGEQGEVDPVNFPGLTSGLTCCGDGCGFLNSQVCVPGGAPCCSTCVPIPPDAPIFNPTGYRCCQFPGGDCTYVPCCEGFVCNAAGACELPGE